MSNIRIESLSYAYPGSTQPVLREINLNIPRGEFLLVAGPSGCGKSTLANAIAGLILTRIPGPMRGKVYFGEKCISEMDIHETAQHIGMVFQNPDNQLIQLDVESEVAFGPENLNLPREVIQQRVKESLKYTHMESHLKNPIYALSGGQKQRIAISAALAMEPDVLVLDEPTSVAMEPDVLVLDEPTSDLDPAGTQEVLKVLQKLNRERNMTIVLIEHKIDEVIPWVNRVLLMDSGQIVLDDSPSGVFREWSKWDDLGVSIPEMVRLSNRLPEVFSGQIALSVEDAFDAIRGTLHHRRLLDLAENGMSEIFQQTSSSSDQLLHWENVGVCFICGASSS
jgi:energy-coupling factor transporter ATP-binding protein EcfA2